MEERGCSGLSVSECLTSHGPCELVSVAALDGRLQWAGLCAVHAPAVQDSDTLRDLVEAANWEDPRKCRSDQVGVV